MSNEARNDSQQVQTYIYMHLYMPTTHMLTTTSHRFFFIIQREFSKWKSKQQRNKQS